MMEATPELFSVWQFCFKEKVVLLMVAHRIFGWFWQSATAWGT